MTYRKFVETHLCPGKSRDPIIQKNRYQLYQQFISFLENINHPLLKEITASYAEMINNLKGGYIPQSFINLIDYLQANHYSYTIVFRTFGHDIHLVKDELAQRTRITHLNDAHFQQGVLKLSNDQELISPEEILRHIKPFQHAAWHDNFSDWQATDENYEGGKLYPIDFDNQDLLTVFFDDNVNKKIIFARPIVGDLFNQHHLQDELVRRGRIVPVTTFKACLDNRALA